MGRKYCCVPECTNNSSTVNITLHRFPMGEARKQIRKQWIAVLKNVRANLIVNDNTRICSEHFAGGFTPDAVPSIFQCKPKQEEKKSRRILFRNIENFHCDLVEEEYVNRPDLQEDTLLDDCDENSIIHIVNDMPVNVEQKQPDIKQKNDQYTQVQYPHMVDVGVQVNLPGMTYEDLKGKDEKVKFYTGFTSFAVFWLYFCTLLKHGADRLNYWEPNKATNQNSSQNKKPGKRRFLRPVDEFLLVCMRLRLGLLQEHLADLFCVSESSVSRIMNTWINFLYDHSKSLVAWPTREQILCNLPRLFHKNPDTRIVIDCTEFFIEKPSSLVSQWLTWSEYKHCNTFKILIGVAPNGMVTFVSRLWGGNTSDRHITEHCGLLPKLEPGDVIMADKGFTIEDLLPADIGLNIPPRVSTKTQMTKAQFFDTCEIASARTVVEMKNEQIKNYRIVHSLLPITEAHLSEQTIFIITAWTNLLPPLLK